MVGERRPWVLIGFMLFFFGLSLLGLIAAVVLLSQPPPRSPWAETALRDLKGMVPLCMVACLAFMFLVKMFDRR